MQWSNSSCSYFTQSVSAMLRFSVRHSVNLASSLISTHAFRLSPAKYFAWDMHRLVKRIEQDEKISFALFSFEIQIFQLRRNFLTAKPILSHVDISQGLKNSQNGRPQLRGAEGRGEQRRGLRTKA